MVLKESKEKYSITDLGTPVRGTKDPIGKDEFRNIMRNVAASVTVITTEHQGKLYGMTATAFSSVCADPPTVLVIVNTSTRSHPGIAASGKFSVNILRTGEEDLAQRFGAKLDQPYEGIDYRIENGGPLLAPIVAHVDCETIDRYEVGTHTIFVGTVVGGGTSEEEPMLYHDGQYKTLV